MTLDGSERDVSLAEEDLEKLRLAYAQHVYREQGATVDRSVVVTGGWQTSRESAYVQASRAREGTEWFLSREELGTQGHDERRIEQLASRMRGSRAYTPSLQHRELAPAEWGRDFEFRLRPAANCSAASDGSPTRAATLAATPRAGADEPTNRHRPTRAHRRTAARTRGRCR